MGEPEKAIDISLFGLYIGLNNKAFTKFAILLVLINNRALFKVMVCKTFVEVNLLFFEKTWELNR